jgi:streptogramin lyase
MDKQGNLWFAERCEANTCAGSSLDPIFEFSPSGKYLRSFGANLFVQPHQIFVAKDGNIWVTDADGKDGKGHTVMKFSPQGKLLMTLGKPGVAGAGPDTFNQPSGVVVAANGDIFVSDGHGGDSNARIVKFSKDGKFLKTWGRKGSAPGEFDGLHGLTIDSRGRLLVADRENARIQIFDQDGKFLDQWKQFSRPSGIFIDSHDVIYVPDNTSVSTTRPDWPRGVRIGNAKTGEVTGFIPDLDQDPNKRGYGVENVVVDSNGTIYGVEVFRKMVKTLQKR